MISSSPLPYAALADAARRTAFHMLKTQARRYARRPWSLDGLHPGLSCAPPDTAVAIAAHLVERESRRPCRWLGFGGEVTLLNAKAALLYARSRRRAQRLTAGPLEKGASAQHVPSHV